MTGAGNSDSHFKQQRENSLKIRLRVLAARTARALHQFPPPRRRGRRESRVCAAPAISCASLCKERCEPRSSGNAGTRDGLAYFALSVTGFVATVIRESFRNLSSIGASGPRLHRPRQARFVKLAPRPPHPRVRDDRSPRRVRRRINLDLPHLVKHGFMWVICRRVDVSQVLTRDCCCTRGEAAVA
jgi:hypothetical protein